MASISVSEHHRAAATAKWLQIQKATQAVYSEQAASRAARKATSQTRLVSPTATTHYQLEQTDVKYVYYRENLILVGKEGGKNRKAVPDLHSKIKESPELQDLTRLVMVELVGHNKTPPVTALQPTRVLCIVYSGYENFNLHLKVPEIVRSSKTRELVYKSMTMPPVLLCISRCNYTREDNEATLKIGLVIPIMHSFTPFRVKGQLQASRVVWHIEYIPRYTTNVKFKAQRNKNFPGGCHMLFVRPKLNKAKRSITHGDEGNRAAFLQAIGQAAAQLLLAHKDLNLTFIEDDWGELGELHILDYDYFSEEVEHVFLNYTRSTQYFLLGFWHECWAMDRAQRYNVGTNWHMVLPHINVITEYDYHSSDYKDEKTCLTVL